MTQSTTVHPLDHEELLSFSPHAKFHSIINAHSIVSISYRDMSTPSETQGLKYNYLSKVLTQE